MMKNRGDVKRSNICLFARPAAMGDPVRKKGNPRTGSRGTERLCSADRSVPCIPRGTEKSIAVGHGQGELPCSKDEERGGVQNTLIYRGVCFMIVIQSRADEQRKNRNNEEASVIKVSQEELKQKIEKLKKAAAEKAKKAEGKKSDAEVRKARKQVKRAQRKLRAAKAYKAAGKKAGEVKPAEEKASA